MVPRLFHVESSMYWIIYQLYFETNLYWKVNSASHPTHLHIYGLSLQKIRLAIINSPIISSINAYNLTKKKLEHTRTTCIKLLFY